MQIKKFEASEMSEALRAIRKEMGPDAVILSTREIKKERGVFGVLSRPRVEVTAGLDADRPMELDQENPFMPFNRIYDEEIQANSESAIPSIREELRTIQESLNKLQSTGNDSDSVASICQEIRDVKEFMKTIVEVRGDSKKDQVGQIRDTLSDARGMLKALVEQRYGTEISEWHQTLVGFYERLLLNGVDRETAVGLLRTMKTRLSVDELWRKDFVHHYLGELIQEMVQVSGPVQGNGSARKVVALVGPTGVGKTTTIAKLAAQHCRNGKRVMLTTLDRDRVGAVDQLKSFAKVIGAPVSVLTSGTHLRLVIEGRKDMDLIFVDTPGRSHLKEKEVAELKELEKVGVPIETHLVLASNTKASDLSDIIDNYSIIPIKNLLFTKTDETRTYGSLLAAMRRKEKPFSYFTTGQRVPEDIEVATPKRVAEFILT